MGLGIGMILAGQASSGGLAPARKGYTTLAMGGTWSEGLAVTQDGSGNILLAGTVNTGAALAIPFVPGAFTFAWYLARFTPAGVLDSTFASGAGYVINTLGDTGGGTDNEATSVLVDGSGNVVVGGIRTQRGAAPTCNFAVGRYTSSGAPDGTFGTSGVYNVSSGGSAYVPTVRVAREASGRLVLATTRNLGINHTRFAWYGVTSAGAADSSFNGGLVQQTAWADTENNTVQASLIDAGGKVVTAGAYNNTSTPLSGFEIGRLSATGTPDTTFGGGGLDSCLARTTFSQPQGAGAAALCQVGTGYVAVGTAGYDASGHQQIALAAYTSTGTLDTSSISGGTALLDVHAQTNALANADVSYGCVMPSGKYVAVGGSVGDSGQGFSDGSRFLLARFNSDGTPDTTWAPSGCLIPAASTTSDVLYGCWPQSDGKLLVCGHKMDDVSSPRRALAYLARYNADGTLDTTFGDLA